MRRFAIFAAAAPGAALAHGGHAPLPEAAHGAFHAGLSVAALAAGAVLVLALIRALRS